MSYESRHYTPSRSYHGSRIKIPYSELSKNLKVERVKHNVGTTALGASVVGVCVLGIGSGLRAFIGSYGPQYPKSDSQKLAIDKYTAAFQAASPAGKFVMQYLRTVNIDHVEYPDAHGWSGDNVLAQDGWGAYWQTSVGNACLENTAYAIAGGKVDVNLTYGGIFSYVSASAQGNIPTAAAYAEVDPQDSNDLLVISGNDHSVSLTLSGLENKGVDELTPANAQTRNILVTYGCSNQVSTSAVINPGQ